MKLILRLFLVETFFLSLKGNYTSCEAVAVTYCVRPVASSAMCPNQTNCQRCETLQYYLMPANVENMNKQKNVTLLFLNGTHTGNCSKQSSSFENKIHLSSQTLAIAGENHHVSVSCLNLEFYEVLYLHTEKLKAIHWKVHFIPSSDSTLHMSSMNLLMSNIGLCGIQYGDARISIQNTTFDSTQLKVDGQLFGTICLRLPDYTEQKNNGYVYRTTASSNKGLVSFTECRFQSGTIVYHMGVNVNMKDCQLIDYQVYAFESNITFSGVSEFTSSSRESALLSFSSTVILSGTVSFFNNTATKGGAMALYSSALKIAEGTTVSFINNTALERGGAIFVDPGFERNLVLMKQTSHSECFYDVLPDSSNYGTVDHTAASCVFNFANNSAKYGGSDIYGASLKIFACFSNCDVPIIDELSVSSDPTRVCLCDDSGEHQCLNNSYIFVDKQVYPGELFTVSVVVVGGDYGPTIGIVHANFLAPSTGVPLPSLTQYMYSQVTNSSETCTQLQYSLHSPHAQEDIVLYLYTTLYTDVQNERDEYCITQDYCAHTTPVYFNITLLPCGPGFTLQGVPPKCDCYHELSKNGVKCKIINGTGYFSWKGSIWMKVEGNDVVYSKRCPFDYCNTKEKQMNDISMNANYQCNFNRAGRLCGGCKDNYSLAIGSSHCIRCTDNNNLALLIFFVAAGFLLVFFIFVLNLTITQGLINGLIFYANIVWTYQGIFFPHNGKVNVVLTFMKTFIAWVNLDFGIESCFFDGLTAVWKTWLQFLFPFYILAIAGLIIVASRCSSRLTNLLGSKAVPVLVTLVLLSYMKLLRVVVSALEFSTVIYTNGSEHSTLFLWSVDGNLTYFGLPHAFLFLAGLATLLFLWLPYVLLLVLVQCLRRLPQGRVLKWVVRFYPVYDAHLAPLKHRHQYWLGVLLLARGFLLMTFASTFGVSDAVNLLLLLIVCVALLFHMTLAQPYLSTAILVLQSSFLINLALLSGFVMLAYTQPTTNETALSIQAVAVGLSTAVAFLQFCFIVIYSVVAPRCSSSYCKIQSHHSTQEDTLNHSDNDQSSMTTVVGSRTVSFRDSILEESQDLLTDEPSY